MLHISICDDEIVAVEKMRKIVGKVLEQEQLLANVGTFENGEEFLNQYIIRDDELVILDLGVFYLICWTMQLRRVRKIKKKRESFARLPEKRTR